MPSYSELLRDPRWQKKRLEVMERQGFECEECGAKHKTLNVHHAYYEKGCKPWEYPADSLHCLCEDCHERVETELREIRKLAGLTSRAARENILGYARASAGITIAGCVNVPLGSLYVARGMGEFFELNASDVWAQREDDGTVNLFELWGIMMDNQARAAGAAP